MFLVLIFIPLICSIFFGFFGRFLGKKGVYFLVIFFNIINSMFSYFIFYDIVLKNSVCVIKGYNWLTSIGFLNISWSFLFDSISSIMLCIVITISCLVQLYSLEYMSKDPHLPRFMSYLNLFTFFMIILVTSNNFFQLFMGWEGVGICSFLLISFWFTRMNAVKSSIKAIIVNKIGDFGIMFAILVIFDTFSSLDFITVFSMINSKINDSYFLFNLIEINKITFITLLLFIGAVGKSAQLGLHTWLPDAMEGPTPVSALIHAATMVTAGVFLIIRCSPLFEKSEITLIIITIVGSLTCFFAATTAILQNDLKKVIAYSTCSQLGYMIFSCGISNYNGSLFHLSNHAFFKALLFLSAGSIIHALNNEQDMRRMGGLINLMPFTYVMFLIGSLALAGFPFLSGFYSKDFILEVSIAKFSFDSIFAYWLGSFSGFCTSFYSFRLIYYTFYSKTNNFKSILENIHETSFLMTFSLSFLCFGSIFIGYFTKDLFIGLGNNTFYNSIFIDPLHNSITNSEFIPNYLKLIPVYSSFLGIIFSLIIFNYIPKLIFKIKITKIGLNFYYFFSKKWYFDNIYNFFIVKNLLTIGYQITYILIDKGILEIFGPLGLKIIINKISINISKIQTGFIYNYSLMFFLGVVFLFGLYIIL